MAAIVCPQREQLSELLAGVLCETEQGELTAHLDRCPRCRQELERLASGEEAWKETARKLGEACASHEPALQEVLADLCGQGVGDPTQAEPGQVAEDSLAFLGPSDKPEHLGRLDHYEVMEVVGRGGMGVVLKAFDAHLHRIVAIKVMTSAMATSASARQRFHREARAAAAVRNEHVIDIFAIGEEKGLPYLVMELIAGRSLQERIDQTGPLQLKEVLRIGLQTARGLAAAHAQGVIHRDIKPANILLENGVERVKITDFGLARAVDDASLTQSGVLTGTPQYMAPEQARGEVVDHRADLFSLGSVLYAMCAGRPPFRAGTTIGVIRQVSDHAPRPIRQINPEVSERLAEIIEKLHAKNPADRFQSALEVAAALEQHLAEVQQPDWSRFAPRAGVLSRHDVSTRKRWRRRWAVVASTAALLLGGLGMTETTGVTQVVPTVIRIARGEGTLVVWVEDPEVQVNVLGEGEEVVLTGAGPREVRLRPGRYHLRASRDGEPLPSTTPLILITRGGKEIVRVSHEPTRPGAAAKPAAAPLVIAPQPLPDFRAGDPLSMLALVGRPAPLPGVRSWTVETTHHRAAIGDVAFSPDGRWLATACRGGAVRIWEAKTRRLVRIIMAPSTTSYWLHGLAWSPDSRYLATCHQEGAVELWEVATGQLVRTLRCRGEIYTVAWSPDGRSLAGSGWLTDVLIWDVSSGVLRGMLKGHKRGVPALAWSPDGKKLATGGEDKTARVWDAETCQTLHTLEGHSGWVWAVAFSPDGLHLATASYDKTVRLWRADQGVCLHTLRGHTDGVWSLAFSPDGKRLASGSTDHTIRLWDLDSGKEIRPLLGHRHIVSALSWSPDGQTLASGSWDTHVRLWPVEEGEEHTLPGNIQWASNFPLWSPDGKYLVTGAHNSRLWSAKTGEQIHAFAEHFGIARAWSPNSKLLATTDWNGGAWFWDNEAHSWRSCIVPHEKVIKAAAWSPDGKLFATGDEGGNVAVWGVNEEGDWRKGQAANWMYVTDFAQGKAGVDALAFSPNGGMFAWADSDGKVHLWDVKRRKQGHTYIPHSKRIRTLAWAPGGKVIATGGEDSLVKLWEPDTDQILHTLTGFRGNIWALAFSPDGKTLATADGWGNVQLWNPMTGGLLRRLHGPTIPVLSLSWSPDGRRLAGGGELATTHVWDVDSGQVQAVLLGLPRDRALVVGTTGHYRSTPDVERDLVYVVQTDQGQETLTPEEFARKYHWKNDPNQVRPVGP
jgi:WD40 repeat protein